MKVYICGKVTGDDHYAEKFMEAKRELEKLGYEAVNPIAYTSNTWTWERCMRVVIRELCLCDAIHLLPDWKDSRGGRLEKQIAEELNLKFV